jgi:hypothetical protein
VQHIHANRNKYDLVSTGWNVQKSSLQDAKPKVLDDQRVLDSDAANKVSENGIEHKDPCFGVLESLDESKQREVNKQHAT